MGNGKPHHYPRQRLRRGTRARLRKLFVPRNRSVRVYARAFGTNSSFTTQDITEYLKSVVVSGISDAIGECKIPVLDMAGNLIELGDMVLKSMQPTFNSLGLELTKFVFENFSMPKELEEALDKNATLGIMRGNLDAYTQMAQADALKEAAKNPGMAGSAMGAGMGFGMGQAFSNMYSANNANKPAEEKTACPKCGAKVSAKAKFCPECGAAMGLTCPKCGAPVKQGAKFCPECGEKLTAACPKCGASVKPGAKFCPECGEKL
ncbi:MAG: zinc-ribbon domain-containing protein [Christensenellales bacterium]